MKRTSAFALVAATICGVTQAQAQEQAPALDPQMVEALEQYLDEEGTVRTSYGTKGFRLESRDGNFQNEPAVARPATRNEPFPQ